MKLQLLGMALTLAAACSMQAMAQAEVGAPVTDITITGSKKTNGVDANGVAYPAYVRFTWASETDYCRVCSDGSVTVYKNGDFANPISQMPSADGLSMAGSGAKSTTSAYTVTAYCEADLTDEATYTFVIAEGSMMRLYPTLINPEFSFDFVVGDGGGSSTTPDPDPDPDPETPVETADVTATPASGSVISTTVGLSSIYLDFGSLTYQGEGTGMATILRDGAVQANLYPSSVSVAFDMRTPVVTLPAEAQPSADGVYTLRFPEGFINLKDADGATVASPAFTLTYTLETPSIAELTWTVSPAEGTVEEISVVTLSFNKPVKKGSYSSWAPLYCTSTRPAYYNGSEVEGKIDVAADGMTVTVTFPTPFRLGGVWDLRFFEGDEQLNCTDGTDFPGIDIYYHIADNVPFTAAPEAGTKMNAIESTTLTFPYAVTLAAAPDFEAYYTDGSERVEATCLSTSNYDFGDLAKAVVAPVEAITKTGNWTLVVEPGSFTLSQFDQSYGSSLINVAYVIEGGFGAKLVPEAGSVLAGFYGLGVDLTNVESVTVNPDKNATLVISHTAWWAVTDYSAKLNATVITGNDGTAFVSLVPADPDALLRVVANLDSQYTYNYTLTVPAGLLTVNGFDWEGASARYTYNPEVGLSSIAADPSAAGVTVHTLQGTCLMRNASADALRTLRPGIYIVNGVKTLLRR